MEHKCNTCFYREMPNSSVSPCKACSGYSHYAKDTMYFWGEKELAKMNDTSQFDAVEKPKHYMLFPESSIEVRDVITKLVEKMEDSSFKSQGMDYSDYVQAMQYFMRFMEKNGKEDLKKGIWYINKIVDNWHDIPNDV